MKNGEGSLQNQVGGNHYKDRAIQPIQYILANMLTYCEGNVIKYVTRHRYKNTGAEDLKKAIQYIAFELEHTYGIITQVQYDKRDTNTGSTSSS